jgi:hypothetical protein
MMKKHYRLKRGVLNRFLQHRDDTKRKHAIRMYTTIIPRRSSIDEIPEFTGKMTVFTFPVSSGTSRNNNDPGNSTLGDAGFRLTGVVSFTASFIADSSFLSTNDDDEFILLLQQ